MPRLELPGPTLEAATPPRAASDEGCDGSTRGPRGHAGTKWAAGFHVSGGGEFASDANGRDNCSIFSPPSHKSKSAGTTRVVAAPPAAKIRLCHSHRQREDMGEDPIERLERTNITHDTAAARKYPAEQKPCQGPDRPLKPRI
ncbi:hypothetical protein E2C01_085948 [Portunus trituberculatus]|uniref:Uncharacterized protein n=1 Tax=Portunus trituberculatus TaxID=210409 RepID=A0A5B7JF14_PORTR|nr:hypothetical protein [Portunus trituberculatus]